MERVASRKKGSQQDPCSLALAAAYRFSSLQYVERFANQPSEIVCYRVRIFASGSPVPQREAGVALAVL